MPHEGQPGAFARRDVLDDDGAGSKVAGDSEELSPEPGAGAGEPGTLAGGGDILAGEASDEDIAGSKNASVNCPNIRAPPDIGPVPRKDGQAEGILLDLEDDAPAARHLETKLQAPDAREEGADLHRLTLRAHASRAPSLRR